METPNEPSINPYQTPSVPVLQETPVVDTASFISAGRTLGAGAGVDWLTAAWRLFVEAPFMWIGMFVIYLLFVTAVNAFPFVGPLVSYLLFGVIAAGWLAAAHAVAGGEKLDLEHLFSGFKSKTSPLFVLGALYAGATITVVVLVVIALVVGVIGVSGEIGALLSGDTTQLTDLAESSMMALVLVVLVGLALFIPVMMAAWFAPALVYFHDVPPLDALKTSFMACLRNFVPFLIFGIVTAIMFVVAIIPLFLGLLVAGPVWMIAAFTSYRAVFTEKS